MIVRYSIMFVIVVCGYYEGECVVEDWTGRNCFYLLCDSYNDGRPF